MPRTIRGERAGRERGCRPSNDPERIARPGRSAQGTVRVRTKVVTRGHLAPVVPAGRPSLAAAGGRGPRSLAGVRTHAPPEGTGPCSVLFSPSAEGLRAGPPVAVPSAGRHREGTSARSPGSPERPAARSTMRGDPSHGPPFVSGGRWSVVAGGHPRRTVPFRLPDRRPKATRVKVSSVDREDKSSVFPASMTARTRRSGLSRISEASPLRGRCLM